MITITTATKPLPTPTTRHPQPRAPPARPPPQDVELADRFFAGHRAPGHTPFPYPRDLFLRFIQENDGGDGWFYSFD